MLIIYEIRCGPTMLNPLLSPTAFESHCRRPNGELFVQKSGLPKYCDDVSFVTHRTVMKMMKLDSLENEIDWSPHSTYEDISLTNGRSSPSRVRQISQSSNPRRASPSPGTSRAANYTPSTSEKQRGSGKQRSFRGDSSSEHLYSSKQRVRVPPQR